MVESCEIENYGDVEYEKFCALVAGDYDAFLSMTGSTVDVNPLSYFSEEATKKFQKRYLLEVLNDERPSDAFMRYQMNGIQYNGRLRKLRQLRRHARV